MQAPAASTAAPVLDLRSAASSRPCSAGEIHLTAPGKGSTHAYLRISAKRWRRADSCLPPYSAASHTASDDAGTPIEQIPDEPARFETGRHHPAHCRRTTRTMRACCVGPLPRDKVSISLTAEQGRELAADRKSKTGAAVLAAGACIGLAGMLEDQPLLSSGVPMPVSETSNAMTAGECDRIGSRHSSRRLQPRRQGERRPRP